MVAFVSHARSASSVIRVPSAPTCWATASRAGRSSAKPRRTSPSATIACIASVVSRNRLPKLSVPLGGRRGRSGWLHNPVIGEVARLNRAEDRHARRAPARVNADGMPGARWLAAIAREYRDVISSTQPPFAVQAALFGALAAIARRTGRDPLAADYAMSASLRFKNARSAALPASSSARA
jgi:hypothetical protein